MSRSLGKWYLVRNDTKWMEAILDDDGEVKIKLAGFSKEWNKFNEVEFNRNNWMNFTYLMHCHLCGFEFNIAHLEERLTIEEYHKEKLEGPCILIAVDGRPGEQDHREGLFLHKKTIGTMLTFESHVLNCFEQRSLTSSTTQ